MRSRTALLIAILTLQVGCCSVTKYEDLRHERDDLRAERDKLLGFIAGAHQDNAMLQSYAIELEQHIRALQGGMIEQAEETAELRRSCDI